MDESALDALLGASIRWLPEVAAPGHYRPEGALAASSPRLRQNIAGPPYTLLLGEGVARDLDVLPAGWVLMPTPEPGDPPAPPPRPDDIPETIALLRHPKPETRQWAIWALHRVADRSVLPALERVALDDTGSVSVERGFVDDHEWIYPDALNALRSLYNRLGLAGEDVARLTVILHAGLPRANGAHRLLAVAGAPLRPALRAALTHPDPPVVMLAARALALPEAEGAAPRPRDPEVERAVLDLLAHPEAAARRAVIDLLEPAVWGESWIGWPPVAWRDAVLARLPVEPDAATRRRLMEFITQHGKSQDPSALLAALRHCRQEPDDATRQTAASRLHWFEARKADPAPPELGEAGLAWARTEPSRRILRSLLWSVPLPRDRATTEWLVSELEANDPETRHPVAARLAGMEPAPAAEALLRAIDRVDDKTRRAALAALAALGDRRALPLIEHEADTAARGPNDRKELRALYRRLNERTRRAGG